MRAKDLTNENKLPELPKRKRFPTRGLNLFSDGEKWNSDYTMHRLMMAAASTDGTFVPELDANSWVGKWRTAHPYTEEEQQMLKKAYQAIGATWRDLNGGDMDSEEPPSTDKHSPIKAFKGYPR
jgi:hypothetical protein